jgi:hypothetical protein
LHNNVYYRRQYINDFYVGHRYARAWSMDPTVAFAQGAVGQGTGAEICSAGPEPTQWVMREDGDLTPSVHPDMLWLAS